VRFDFPGSCLLLHGRLRLVVRLESLLGEEVRLVGSLVVQSGERLLPVVQMHGSLIFSHKIIFVGSSVCYKTLLIRITFRPLVHVVDHSEV